jgi:hypothetical protein
MRYLVFGGVVIALLAMAFLAVLALALAWFWRHLHGG